MFSVFFLFLLLNIEVLGQSNYKIPYLDTRVDYAPGYICNVEAHYVPTPSFVLWTCQTEGKCEGGGKNHRTLWQPQLQIDNCGFVFNPPKDEDEIVNYVCCHPADNEDTKNNFNATTNFMQPKYMPGLRSAMKCSDYKQFVCLSDKYCPTEGRRKGKGGFETEILKYPHVAYIGWHEGTPRTQNWFCIGSIVSEKFILTAASCKKDKNGKQSTAVRVGLNTVCDIFAGCSVNNNEHSGLYEIDEWISYPANHPDYYYHDIMLMKVASDIRWNKDVRPACLFTKMDTEATSGMFAYYEEGFVDKPPEKIHEKELPVISKSDCYSYFKFDQRAARYVIVDSDIMFCAGSQELTPCQGDHGAALAIQEPEQYCIWQLYGVLAWSERICPLAKAGVFTRVSYYLSWIEGVVWPDFDLTKQFDSSSICAQDGVDALAITASTVLSNSGRCRA